MGLIRNRFRNEIREELIQDLLPRSYDEAIKARELKPDYWPPYFQWGGYLMRAGQKNEAREVVEAGLSFAPQSKALRGLLVELGGNPATIKPRPADEKPAESAK